MARAIHGSGRRMVIAVTGGGSGALSALMQTPGASRSVLEVVVPYSFAALVDWIGGEPNQACSEATARAMAMAAFVRARKLLPDADVSSLIGIGCTASLATDRPKRGERRIHAAVQTFDCASLRSLWLRDGAPTREQDEVVAGAMLLTVIAEGCDVDAVELSETIALLRKDEVRGVARANAELAALVFGERRLLIVAPQALGAYLEQPPASLPVVFPGAFNPPHAGHFKMAAIAEARLKQPAAWELSVTNVDKPPLDFRAIERRITSLRKQDAERVIALTRAPTFREKAALFPGATFIVGADTMLRIAELRYYAGDVAERDAAMAAIASRGCRFLVFGRELGGRFVTLGELELPTVLHRLCDEVPAADFREDVSSTELRQAGVI